MAPHISDTLRENYQLKGLNMKDFEIVSKSKKGQQLSSQWFYECERQDKPFITISNRTKFCDVKWDYITLSRETEAVISNNKVMFIEGLKALRDKYDADALVLDEFLAIFNDVLIEDGSALATSLAHLLREAMTDYRTKEVSNGN